MRVVEAGELTGQEQVHRYSAFTSPPVKRANTSRTVHWPDVTRRLKGFLFLERETKTQMADKVLTCRDCGTTFTFTEGEQAFYQQKGFSEPIRCPDCRAAKRASRNSGAYSDNYGGGGYGGYNSGGYGRPERVSTQVICDNCGKETYVPFVPRGDRPVYCSDCFNQVGGGNRNRNSNRY